MTLGEIVIKCPRKRREDLWKSQILLILTNFPNVMVLVCNTMIDEECFEFFWEFDVCSCMLMRGKLEICPVWGKLEIKFPGRTKETEAIMVQYYSQLYNTTIYSNC